MNAETPSPADRAAFDRALGQIRADHAALRHLAVAVCRRPGRSADNALSLVDAVTAHENAEARLFALPFLTRPPATVTASAARARRRCLEYSTASDRLPNASAAAAVFADALLVHLAVEDAWLAEEAKQHHERLLQSI